MGASRARATSARRRGVAAGAMILALGAAAGAESGAPPTPLGEFVRAFHAPADDAAQDDARPAIGIVTIPGSPACDDAVRGAALAVEAANADLAPGEAGFTLEVAEASGRWGTAAEAGRDLRYDRGCVGLITPADRAVAHLLAQIAIRGRVPVVTLAPDASLTRIPDPWVFRVVPQAADRRAGGDATAPFLGDGEAADRFRDEYRERHGAAPSLAAARGHDAAAVLIAAARRAGLGRAAVREWLARAVDLPVSTGLARFDGAGNLIASSHEPTTRPGGPPVRSDPHTSTEPRERVE